MHHELWAFFQTVTSRRDDVKKTDARKKRRFARQRTRQKSVGARSANSNLKNQGYEK